MYKVRCRVAESGTTTLSPESGAKRSTRRLEQDWELISKSPQTDEDEIYIQGSASDASSDNEIIEFIAEKCLFCNQTSKDFDENLLHMRQTHSLVVPFQFSLAVDLQTLVWFLHMIIFSYRECICCGKRRRTVEAVQQHMISTGHCRFDLTEEMSIFYTINSLGQQTTEGCSHVDDHTLKLPSGKLLTHRSHVGSTSKSRLREKPHAGPSTLPASQQSSTGPQALTKRDRKELALTIQLTQLRTGDQMSLVHLPESQQRSLLAAHKKELGKAKRAERRKRGQVDNVGNKTAIHAKYYKQEVPVYMGG